MTTVIGSAVSSTLTMHALSGLFELPEEGQRVVDKTTPTLYCDRSGMSTILRTGTVVVCFVWILHGKSTGACGRHCRAPVALVPDKPGITACSNTGSMR